MNKVTSNFDEQTIFVGLDIYEGTWNAALFLNDQFLHNIHQPPSPRTIYKHLSTHYPGASYKGIKCLVINPADIPSTHKDEVSKTDPRDARGISMALQWGQLKSIYIPTFCRKRPLPDTST